MTAGEEPRGWRLGAPGGVPIHLSASWPLLAVFMVVYFGPQVAQAVPGIGASAYLVAALYALLLMLSVLAHEGAHAMVARAVGARVGRIVLDLFGGHTLYEPGRPSPGRTALIAVAGPIANGLLALLGWFVLPHLPSGVPWLIGGAFVFGNAVVGAFNLVPGHPLDGGHLLDAVIWRLSGRRDLGLVVSGWMGRLVVVALVGWFVVLPLLDGSAPSLVMFAWTGLVGAMLWAGASQAIRAGRHLGAYARMRLEDVLSPVVVVTADTPMSSVVDRARGATTESGSPPLVVAHGPAGLGIVHLPSGLDTAAATRTPASAFTSRPADGWILDVDEHPTPAQVVDHMHGYAVPVVALRHKGRLIGAVTAGAVNDALTRAPRS